MEDLPVAAQAVAGLGPGESFAGAWKLVHLPSATVSRLSGFLVLTSSRILFIMEAGGFSKVYQAVPPLTWPLSDLQDPISLTGKGSALAIRGEIFQVARGGSQEAGRAQWTLENARTKARGKGVSTLPPSGQLAAQLRALATAPPTTPPSPKQTTPSPVAPPIVPSVSASSTTVPTAPTTAQDPLASSGGRSTPPTPAPALAPSSQGLSRPGSPTWPMVPVTLVETTDPNSFWSIVGSSGVDRAKLMVFCTESPGELSASYGLAGASIWRISSNEGEGRVRPGDVDRLGDLISGHFDKDSGQGLALKGFDRIMEEAGFRSARKLLEVAREAAERTRGAVIIHADPVTIGPKELHQLEDDVKVLKL
jgi:hypothetical protein